MWGVLYFGVKTVNKACGCVIISALVRVVCVGGDIVEV